MNILFICSRNQWRSRTAETIFNGYPAHRIKSAGTEKVARIKVNEKLVHWAELIFVMEKKHKERIKEQFGPLMNNKTIIILDIPDNYKYMDPELVEILNMAVAPYLK